MPIRVECPACGQLYQVSDDKAGRKFRCKSCEEYVLVPEFDATEEEEFFEDELPVQLASNRSSRSDRVDRPADDGILSWWLLPWKRWNEIEGRSRRKEYWIFQLGNTILFIVANILAGVLQTVLGDNLSLIPNLLIAFCIIVYGLAAIAPGITVSIRRMHDIGRSGWWILICLIPLIGGLIYFVLTLLDSQQGKNQWGPSPKR